MKESKPRLSRRMARQLVKNLILRLDIEELVEHPESAKSAEIRAKYLAEIERRNERIAQNRTDGRTIKHRLHGIHGNAARQGV